MSPARRSSDSQEPDTIIMILYYTYIYIFFIDLFLSEIYTVGSESINEILSTDLALCKCDDEWEVRGGKKSIFIRLRRDHHDPMYCMYVFTLYIYIYIDL